MPLASFHTQEHGPVAARIRRGAVVGGARAFPLSVKTQER